MDNGAGGSTTANNTVTFSGEYNHIAFVDVSRFIYGASGTSTKDGFDLDAFKVSIVPLPAGALLLGTALAGLGLIRRKA